jgi:carboxyl-terminal processing protease
MFLRSTFKFFSGLVLVFLCSHGAVFAANDSDVLAENEIASSAKPNEPIPKEDIQRFVEAMSIVKQSYIRPVKDNTLFNSAIRGMVSSLDPHSSFLDANDLKDLRTTVSGEFVGIGVELTTEDGALKVISPLEDSPANKVGIKPDDMIIKINNKLVQNMTLREAINHIKGKADTLVRLTIIRKGEAKPLELNVNREVVKIQSVKSKMLENGYGYVRLSFFQGPVDDLMRSSLQTLVAQNKGPLKGLVLDLRNNPGGLLEESAKIVDMFLNSGSLTHKYNDLIVYTKGRIPGQNIEFKAHPDSDITNGVPMVVLINGGSASASEIVAGALQDYHRAVIMGTRSFGKGSVQTVFPINENYALKLTTALYHTPSGRVIQAKGIEPDVVVPDLKIDASKMSDLLSVDEADFENHISGVDETASDEQKLEARKKQREAELKLAKTDYQLYQALVMLRGMNAMKKQKDAQASAV